MTTHNIKPVPDQVRDLTADTLSAAERTPELTKSLSIIVAQTNTGGPIKAGLFTSPLFRG